LIHPKATGAIMSTKTAPRGRPEIEYPETDGQPMAENTLQFQWIVTIEGGIDALFKDNPTVFVAGDLFWYPVEGEPGIRTAPDTLVVFGRPKGHRGSYRQWEEGNIAPQVVFEVRSPGNRFGEMLDKFRFYERYGVEEYYLYDPDFNELEGWIRNKERLQAIEVINGWKSPRLGIRFVLERNTLVIYRPDGRKFSTYLELEEERTSALKEAELATRAVEQERKERERLAAKLRELGVDPRS
jgi:Uma2 family endonuclease